MDTIDRTNIVLFVEVFHPLSSSSFSLSQNFSFSSSTHCQTHLILRLLPLSISYPASKFRLSRSHESFVSSLQKHTRYGVHASSCTQSFSFGVSTNSLFALLGQMLNTLSSSLVPPAQFSGLLSRSKPRFAAYSYSQFCFPTG